MEYGLIGITISAMCIVIAWRLPNIITALKQYKQEK